MRPDVVTFWHGPLDRAAADLPAVAGRRRPQGHRLQFRSAAGPARRRRQCRGRSDPAAFLFRTAAPAAAGRQLARLDHSAIQRFLPDAADGGARRPVARRRRAAAEADRDRSGKTLFRLGAAAPARQFGSVSAARRSDRAGVRGSDGAGGVDAGLAGAAPSPHLHAAPVTRPVEPPLRHPRRDLRPGRADRARAPIERIAARVAEAILLCGACRAETVLRAEGFFRLLADPANHRPAHFTERPRRPEADPRQSVCLGGGEVRQ